MVISRGSGSKRKQRGSWDACWLTKSACRQQDNKTTKKPRHRKGASERQREPSFPSEIVEMAAAVVRFSTTHRARLVGKCIKPLMGLHLSSNDSLPNDAARGRACVLLLCIDVNLPAKISSCCVSDATIAEATPPAVCCCHDDAWLRLFRAPGVCLSYLILSGTKPLPLAVAMSGVWCLGARVDSSITEASGVLRIPGDPKSTRMTVRLQA